MFKSSNTKDKKHYFLLITIILFFVLCCVMLIDGVVNNSQSEGAFLPNIRLVGEYKIGDEDWKPIVEGEHIPATKGDVLLRGVLEFGDFETNEIFGVLSSGTLVSLNLNHINFSVYNNGQAIYVSDIENSFIGEDACGHVWQIFEYVGEDGYIEAKVHNQHKFGNDTAVDDLLASMNVYVGDYFEKMALSSGQSERLIAIIVLIVAFIALGIALFCRILAIPIYRTSFYGGLLILCAGIFILFTSRAFYLWFDTVIVNTMMTVFSAMSYYLFAVLLIKSLFSDKMRKAADIVSLIYLIFILVLVFVSFATDIYLYDMLSVWGIGVITVTVFYLIFAAISLNKNSFKRTFALVFSMFGLVLFVVDIAAVYLGLWQTGLVSKIFFLIGFIVSVFSFLHIVPEKIKEAEKAELLEKEKITLDAELAQSRMATLISQIHPHFIYNTLGSIEQLCELDPPKAAKLVNDFSKYLRGNFSEIDNPKLIRVSKELEHTEYYISIEKVRFPDIEFITEMTCSDFSIPALTIQPIVENAIKHGVLKKEEGGTVRVKIYETDSSYFISVKDNGVGFDVSEMQQTNHVGLRNIRSRLDAMCGGVLHVESIIGVGSKITVEIPKEAY